MGSIIVGNNVKASASRIKGTLRVDEASKDPMKTRNLLVLLLKSRISNVIGLVFLL